MDEVILEGIEFFANHGYYDEEQKVGNRYVVDVVVNAPLHAAGESDLLSQTVNYEKIYKIVNLVMSKPARLLEHLAHLIIENIKVEYPEIHGVEVKVSKHNPPIGGICQKACVKLKRHF
ncbi:MAG: dihydroneopterin aldolase [Cytophagales bacterium]